MATTLYAKQIANMQQYCRQCGTESRSGERPESSSEKRAATAAAAAESEVKALRVGVPRFARPAYCTAGQ